MNCEKCNQAFNSLKSLSNHRRYCNPISYDRFKEIIIESDIRSLKDYRKRYRDLGLNGISDPYKVFNDFEGWDLILGNFKSKTPKKSPVESNDDKYLSFDDAVKYVRALQLKTGKDYEKWWDLNRPKNLPKQPRSFFKDKWVSIRHWLGIEVPSNIDKSKIRLDFNSARNYVRSLGLKSYKEWIDYCKSGKKPYNIPQNPNVYDEFIDFSDWLGCEDIVSVNGKRFLPFEEAREYIHTLGLNTMKDYRNWWYKNKPKNIPSNPHKKYEEFKDFADWLGCDPKPNSLIFKSKILPFEEARSYVRSLNLKNYEDWRNFCKNKPDFLPYKPDKFYSEFISMGDWLGTGIIANRYVNKENNEKILNYLLSIKNQLINLDIIELVTIIQQSEGGFFYEKISKNENFKKLISSKSEDSKNKAIESLIQDFNNTESNLNSNSVLDSEFLENCNDPDDDQLDDKGSDKEDDKNVLSKTKKTIKSIQSLDDCKITASLDHEAIDFLIENRINSLWNQFMNNDLDIDVFKESIGGDFFNIVKNKFLSQYEDLSDWNFESEIVGNYIFAHRPNMMQKLFAKRVMEKRRYGNWSGVGAGKTLASILATKVTNSSNTLIITFNSTTDNWSNSINQYFDNNNIIIKDKNPKFNKDKSNYLILNYEFFQQPDSESVAFDIINNNKIDFIILDEVHLTKQRDESISKRRDIILKLLSTAKIKNPEIYQIAMSATPVVNNLFEAKALLEMLMLDSYDDLDTTPTINNALQIHKHLVLNGLRYKPKYNILIEEVFPSIDGKTLIESLSKVGKGRIIEMEQVLLDLKLSEVSNYLKPGTIIYSEYVDGIVTTIKDYCESLGYSVGLYTGDDKTGFEKFKNRQVDILIGSKPINTGVDGLQTICDNLVVLSLPWTNADYEQLVGRIYRQGSKFGSVRVVVPKVVIDMNEYVWSWDRDRFDRIQYKKSLSDCAVDGVVPTDKILSQNALLLKAKKSIEDWIDRVKNDNILSVDRYRIELPLMPDVVNRLSKKLGDFSEMNKSWSLSKSSNLKSRLDSNPEEWNYYHHLYREARKNWTEIPYIEISKKIKNRPDWIVGDFGCGENLLSKELTNKVYAFDYISADDSVISCDVSKVPLEDSTLDVVVFSLSLMGSNYDEYLKEAFRVLKPYGNLFICEPFRKWENNQVDFIKLLTSIGFNCLNPKVTSKFIYIDAIKNI